MSLLLTVPLMCHSLLSISFQNALFSPSSPLASSQIWFSPFPPLSFLSPSTAGPFLLLSASLTIAAHCPSSLFSSLPSFHRFPLLVLSFHLPRGKATTHSSDSSPLRAPYRPLIRGREWDFVASFPRGCVCVREWEKQRRRKPHVNVRTWEKNVHRRQTRAVVKQILPLWMLN